MVVHSCLMINYKNIYWLVNFLVTNVDPTDPTLKTMAMKTTLLSTTMMSDTTTPHGSNSGDCDYIMIMNKFDINFDGTFLASTYILTFVL